MAISLEAIRRFSSWADVARLERAVERALARLQAPAYREVSENTTAAAGETVVGTGTLTVLLPAGRAGDTITVVRTGGTVSVDGIALNGSAGNNARTFTRTLSGWVVVGGA